MDGLCTFGSQYARNFAAYSFVLSGYTAAIVEIPGALDAGNAFYTATARVTEISLGSSSAPRSVTSSCGIDLRFHFGKRSPIPASSSPNTPRR